MQAGRDGAARTGPVRLELSIARDAVAGARGEGDAKAAHGSVVSRALHRHLPCGAARVEREGKGLRAGGVRGALRGLRGRGLGRDVATAGQDG